MLPAAISIASEESISTLTTPSDLPYLFPSDDPNNFHVINKDVPFLGRAKIGYHCRKRDKKDAKKRQGSIALHVLIRARYFVIVIGFPLLIQRQVFFLGTSSFYVTIFDLVVVFVSLPSFTLPVELILWLFSSCYTDHSL